MLPFLTGQIPQIGSALSPMHIPVLLCGFVCGAPLGALCGFVTPLLRSLLFGMPPLYPTAAAMAFELAAYGAPCGIFQRLLPRRPLYTYCALILSMLGGGVVWAAARAVMSGVSQAPFTWEIFLSGAFLNALPGIALQLVLIPPIVIALQKYGALDE